MLTYTEGPKLLTSSFQMAVTALTTTSAPPATAVEAKGKEQFTA